MILIVACHYSGHGYGGVDKVYSFNKYVLSVLSLGGGLGDVCFVLISGYFMVYSRFTLRKLVKLVAQTWFYSVILGLLSVFVLFPEKTVTVKSFLKIFVPVSTDGYWFVTIYVVLMLISPLLNLLIANMSREIHRNVLIGATVMWSVLPTCFGSISFGYSRLGWFVALYFFAAYIRKYVDMESGNAQKHIRGDCLKTRTARYIK
jgi:hypothetical protein